MVQAGDELIDVPASALLTEDCVPKDFKAKHQCVSVHGLLSSFLASGSAETKIYAPWQATWPSFADFRECIPMLWSEKLKVALETNRVADSGMYSLLPPALRDSRCSVASFGKCNSHGLLRQQENRFLADWEKVQKALPKADKETYLYYWLIVNTRSFYFELPGSKGPKPKADHMALCPFVDLFNHADHEVGGMATCGRYVC